jgi:hypothetical protein
MHLFFYPVRFILNVSKQKRLRIANLTNVYLYLKILFPIPKHVFGKISKPQNVCNLANPVFLRVRVSYNDLQFFGL